MEDLFQMLDVDDGGTLSQAGRILGTSEGVPYGGQAEFLEGLLNLLLLDVPIWAIQTLKLLRPMRKQTLLLSRDLQEIKLFLGMDAVPM